MTDPPDAPPTDSPVSATDQHLPTGEPPPPNEGARLLLALGSLRQTAQRLGVSPSTVVRWSQGAAPGDDAKAALSKIGIPRDAWTRAARVPGRPVEPGAAPPPGTDAPEPTDRFTRRALTMAEVDSLLAEVRRRRADDVELAGRDFSTLVATESRLLAQKEKLIQADRGDELDLAKAPRWQRIKTLLAKLLVARDRALAAEVAELLEREGLG